MKWIALANDVGPLISACLAMMKAEHCILRVLGAQAPGMLSGDILFGNSTSNLTFIVVEFDTFEITLDLF